MGGIQMWQSEVVLRRCHWLQQSSSGLLVAGNSSLTVLEQAEVFIQEGASIVLADAANMRIGKYFL